MYKLSFLAVILLIVISCQKKYPKPFYARKILTIDSLYQLATRKEINFEELVLFADEITQKTIFDLDTNKIISSADLFHSNGKFLLDSMFYLEAEVFYRNALALRKTIYQDSNQIDILRAKHNIGYAIMRGKNNFQNALDYYDQIEDKYSLKLPPLYFANNLRKGFAYWKLGEYSTANHYFKKSYKYLIENPNDSQLYNFYAELLQFHSGCLRESGNYAAAISKGEEAVKFVLQNSLLDYEADADLVLGNAWQEYMFTLEDRSTIEYQNARNQAILYTQSALKKYIDQNDLKNSILVSANLGELYRRIFRFKDAEQILLKGIQKAKQNQLIQSGDAYTSLLINLGEVYFDKGEYEKALKQYKLALSILNKGNSTVTSMEGTFIQRLVLLSDIPQTYIAQYKQSLKPELLKVAAENYDKLFSQVNYLRGNIVNDNDKITLAKKSQQWIHKAFDGYMKLYNLVPKEQKFEYLEKAFQMSEQSKAFALLEAARLRNISRFLPDDLQKEELKVMELARKANGSLIEKEKAEKATRQYLNHLQQKKPDYYALKFKGPDLRVQTIKKKLLGKDQAILAFFCQDSALYSFYFDAEGRAEIDSVQISKRALTNKVDAFLEVLTDSSNLYQINKNKDAQLLQRGHDLYQLLLGRKWRNRLKERLIIIPDAALSRLPFEALLKDKIKGNIEAQIENKNFAVFEFSFSYCFSANMLMEMQQQEVPSALKKKLAVFAPAGKERDVSREVKNIKRLSSIPVIVYPLEFSTKAEFWNACQNYSYIHIATHGFKVNNPDSNYIRFSPLKESPNDTALYLNELYNHKFIQELIDLSACETASGTYQVGEGNLSMARGLAYGGTRSIVSTLWQVPTHGKASIMSLFYQHLASNPKDKALTKAKRDYLLTDDVNPHPIDWAGYVLLGTSSTSKSSLLSSLFQ